jgi:thiamine monophosphate synthase
MKSSKTPDYEPIIKKLYERKQRGFIIANFLPKDSADRGGRNIWKEDKEEIIPIAKKYGYELLINDVLRDGHFLNKQFSAKDSYQHEFTRSN